MSIIKQIYTAKVKDFSKRHLSTSITVNGRTYFGWAYCHPEDMDFCSEKVGATIAHMRAIIEALKDQRDTAHTEWKVLKKAYCDAYQNKEDNLDEPNPFRTAVWQAENRYHRYQKEVKIARESLRDYLRNHEKALQSIRRQRSIKAKED